MGNNKRYIEDYATHSEDETAQVTRVGISTIYNWNDSKVNTYKPENLGGKIHWKNMTEQIK